MFTGEPVPFHRAQDLTWSCNRRFVGMIAGTQSGKTCFGPWWLYREVRRQMERMRLKRRRAGATLRRQALGDFLVVTASYKLFNNKLLPEFLRVFETILGLGRFWASAGVFELRDPVHGYWADRSTGLMYGRVLLGSANAVGGLEAATALAAWLDEAGQDEFGYDAWKAIRRRLSLTKGPVLLTTTLYNLGWVKQHFIDRAEAAGTKVIETTERGGEIEYTDNPDADVAVIQYDSIVNPLFSVEEFEQARATMPSDEFDMFYRGRVSTLRYLIYNSFDQQRHTCPRFQIPDTWPRYLGLDFGGSNTAGIFYAEEPGTERLFAYREYHAGGRTAAEHVSALLEGEPGLPFAVGGSGSEQQWRDEFSAGGLPVRAPRISDVNLQINRVYGCHKQDQIIYFDDLAEILDEKGRYKRKRDRAGNVTDEIENKNAFHLLDAERYIISAIRGGPRGISYEDWLRQTYGRDL